MFDYSVIYSVENDGLTSHRIDDVVSSQTVMQVSLALKFMHMYVTLTRLPSQPNRQTRSGRVNRKRETAIGTTRNDTYVQ